MKLDEKETVAMLSSILKDNEQLLGLWWSMKDPSILFDTKSENSTIPDEWYAKNGEFSPYVTRSKSGIIVQTGAEYNEESAWIKGPKEANKEFFTKPYIYPISGVDTLMTTISMPLYKDGKYAGVIGAEIALDTFAKLASSIKVYENGYAFIVDNHGVILGHPKKEVIAKDLLEISKNDKNYEIALDRVKELKDFSFDQKAYDSGLDAHYYVKAFNIKGPDINWSIFINAPTEEYLELANFIRNFSIISSLIGIIIIGIMIVFSVRQLKSNLNKITEGLKSFFFYLNKESDKTESIDLVSNDEFG